MVRHITHFAHEPPLPYVPSPQGHALPDSGCALVDVQTHCAAAVAPTAVRGWRVERLHSRPLLASEQMKQSLPAASHWMPAQAASEHRFRQAATSASVV